MFSAVQGLKPAPPLPSGSSPTPSPAGCPPISPMPPAPALALPSHVCSGSWLLTRSPQARSHTLADAHLHTLAHTHTPLHTHLHTLTHPRTCTHLHMHTRTDSHTLTHTHARAHTHTHTPSHTHTLAYAYSHILARTHLHTHPCTCTHLHTPSHMHTLAHTPLVLSKVPVNSLSPPHAEETQGLSSGKEGASLGPASRGGEGRGAKPACQVDAGSFI